MDGSRYELCCCLPPLEFHPLQWVKTSFVAFATSIRVSNLVAAVLWLMCAMVCRPCLVRALFGFWLCIRIVSMSRRAVFAEWFVIIHRHPLGNAPGLLCKYVLLHPPKNYFFHRYKSTSKSESTHHERKSKYGIRGLLKHTSTRNRAVCSLCTCILDFLCNELCVTTC